MKSFQELHEDFIIAQHNLQLALQPVNGEDGVCISDVEFALYELNGVIQEIEERCDK